MDEAILLGMLTKPDEMLLLGILEAIEDIPDVTKALGTLELCLEEAKLLEKLFGT